MKKTYIQPQLKALAVDQESLLDTISGGTGNGTNSGANAKVMPEESAMPRYSVWDDTEE